MNDTVAFLSFDTPNPAMIDRIRDALAPIPVVQLAELDDEALALVRVAIVDGGEPMSLRSLPQLELVHTTWAGVDALIDDIDPDVHLVRMIDPNLTAKMAEAALTWVLYLHRDGPAYARQQRRAEWVDHPPVLAADRRVGVLGLGVLGTAVAATLRMAGFDVAGWSRSAKSIDGVETYIGDDGFDALIARSDIVVNLLPHTPDTEGLLNADVFDRLPGGASLINLGRGRTVDEAALIDALDGAMSHAVLDVFEVEPLPGEHPFWSRDDVTVLPHVAAWTDASTAADIVAANVRAYLADGTLPAGALVDRRRGY